jgi:hypothetical protein
MIKFFRKIRYNLMEKNKTGKYFKYAIGEIVLVVIGILIALQINNWNTKKNTKLKEKDALSEILQDLKSDNEQLKKIKNDEGNIVKIIDFINLEYKQRGRFQEDSLQVYLGKALVGNRPKFVNTAYSVLISSDIGLIQDKDLRYLIAHYYERELPAIERKGNDIYIEWYDAILPIIRKEADYWSWGEILVPYSMDSLFENKDLIKVLKTNIHNHFSVEGTATRVLLENEKLIKKIEPLIQK